MELGALAGGAYRSVEGVIVFVEAKDFTLLVHGVFEHLDIIKLRYRFCVKLIDTFESMFAHYFLVVC